MGLVAFAAFAALAFGGEGEDAVEAAEAAVVDPAVLRAEVAAILSGDEASAYAPTELVGLGEDVLPVLLECLVTGVTPAGEPLDADREQTILLAFEETKTSVRRAFLRSAVAEEPADERAVALLRVLERTGSAEDLGLAVGLAENASAEGRAEVAQTLAGTVEAMLARDGRTWTQLRDEVKRSSSSTADALVHATERAGGLRALEVLTDLLGHAPEMDLALLSRLGPVAAELGGPVPAEVAARAREYLHDEDTQIARAAAVCAGTLEDEDAVEGLIPLLDHESEAARAAASWALQRITGLGLGEDRERWAAWYAEESMWYAKRAESLFDDLSDRNPIRVRNALHELGGHSFRSRTIAEHVARTLHHGDLRVRRTACSVLGRLGVRSVAPALVDALDGEESEEARDALEALTGWRLPADREVWEEALSSGEPG